MHASGFTAARDFERNHVFVLRSPGEWGQKARHPILKRCYDVFHLPPSAAVLRYIVSAFLEVHDLPLTAGDVWGETEALRHVCEESGCQQVVDLVVRLAIQESTVADCR